MSDDDLLEKAMLSLLEATTYLQLLSYSDSNVNQWITISHELFLDIRSLIEDKENEC